MPKLHIHLLGDFRLVYADAPVSQLNAPRLQALLAYLVLHREAPQPRHHLAFQLWPDTSEAQARTNRGREALKQLFVGYRAAFDVHAAPKPDLLIAEGDLVAHRETVRVKHNRTFQGIPATGKEATVTSTDIYRIVNGKIVEQWTEADMLGLMQQLGIVPRREHG